MISAKAKSLLLFFLGAVVLFAVVVIAFVSGVLPSISQKEYSSEDFGDPEFSYRLVDYSDLAGWLQDDITPAVEAFLRSCAILDEKADGDDANPSENFETAGLSMGGKVSDWREPCAEARALDSRLHSDRQSKRSVFRSFFEFYFRPVQIISKRAPLPEGPARRAGPASDDTGIFTGYFEPAYNASKFRTARHQAPLYARPKDLVAVDLGLFRDDLKGRHIAGRVENGRLVPYADRAAINAGAIAEHVEPIAWLDANDLFFLQIQGSGQLLFDHDEAIRVNYAAQNGHPYTAIGKVMVEHGMLSLEDVSMQTIREWLENSDPTAAQRLREENASYVFFRDLGPPEPGMGPPGAQGVPLTPGRSLAVDRRYHTLGAPVWIDIEPVDGLGASRIQRLMVAQDTGGAIKGPIRGDVFWGSGPLAGEIAGRMNVRGKMFVLVPRSIADRLAGQSSS